MKVLGIIPSRYASSRFPGKPLVDILGKSMIQRVYEQAAQSKMIQEVIVATDDKRIFDHVIAFGGNAEMTSMDHNNGTERCGEVIENHPDVDIVINIQGDEPLIEAEQLEHVIRLFEDPEVQIGTLAKKMHTEADIMNPNRVKTVLDKDNFALYFSRSPLPYTSEEDRSKWLTSQLFYKHIGIYAWRRETLSKILQLSAVALEKAERLEQLRWLYHGYRIKVAETKKETPNIDTPEDLKEVIEALKG